MAPLFLEKNGRDMMRECCSYAKEGSTRHQSRCSWTESCLWRCLWCSPISTKENLDWAPELIRPSTPELKLCSPTGKAIPPSQINVVIYCSLELSQIPYPGSPNLPKALAPPNNILFVQNLHHETTPMMLQMLFLQYPGFKAVRMVETKPGIAFVEYTDEMQSTIAMQALQGFKLTPGNPTLITYTKK